MGLTLMATPQTHVHGDHLTRVRRLKQRTECQTPYPKMLDLPYPRKIDFAVPGIEGCGRCPINVPEQCRRPCAASDQG